MDIRPQEINRFRSIEQARAYRSAQSLIQDIRESEARVMKLDDNGVDINRSIPGDVLIVDGKNILSGKHGLMGLLRPNYQDIHLQFEPATGLVKDFEARGSRGKGGSFAPVEHHYRATLMEGLGNIAGSFIGGAGLLGPSVSMSMASGREPSQDGRRGTDVYRRGGETVTVDHRSGVITYVMQGRDSGKLNPLTRRGLTCIESLCSHMLEKR